MSRRDIGTDDPRVRVRPGRSTKPRSKQRPDYSSAPVGRVVAIDRGRYKVFASGVLVSCVKARELGRGGVVMGDLVRLSGDVAGKEGTLARIVAIEPRQHVLRRSLEDAEGKAEKIIAANTDLMVIVTATADPEPRVGMVERCLVAAREARVPALLCMTKTDLADPQAFIDRFRGFDLDWVAAAGELEDLRAYLENRFSVLVGHSGVGKSTLINQLVPDADRQVGHVNAQTGKGRHTSTSSVALELPGGGWVVDTPGVRSFGLGHATADHVLEVFPGLSEVAATCLPLCTHLESEPSCALSTVADQELVSRARAILEGLSSSTTG
ncbi:ribosome small subunit-dependent GTPase A [Actinomycetaceae bacterium WB03_NA08]|uniref:Ribosome small subunit-dependent GTPase A n=1 Tax=Scrofimicrobium canadense TaxID=2652290 RepID=A0A6N7W5X0_9ACTO|nr:ribosome small subunit-dependent GTPase A [Scrofimicrobium canadense]MSS83832.1 ribosome small subunit-dependent GTPase A [Scrofimicrobium canadense]